MVNKEDIDDLIKLRKLYLDAKALFEGGGFDPGISYHQERLAEAAVATVPYLIAAWKKQNPDL